MPIMDWFTSDTHFNHRNIIQYCNRPFKDVNHMNLVLMQNWNERVALDDTVYHLGDFALGPVMRWPEFVKNLNGYKILVRGNHDGSKAKMLRCGFNEVHDSLEYQGWKLVHDPNGQNGKILCGHVHDAWKLKQDNNCHIVNVGVDQWNFRPVAFDELMLVSESAQ